MTKSSTTKILFAGLTGLAAGVAIGLLFAPESGSKARKRLKKRVKEVSENFREEFSDEIEKIKTILDPDGEKESTNNFRNKKAKSKTS